MTAGTGIEPLPGGVGVAGSRGVVVVSGVASDSHTWNLVYLQLLIEELGYDVVNLGPCVPDDMLVSRVRDLNPAMLVLSSVNGHGHTDGVRVGHKLRAEPSLVATPMVIGGKLGITAAIGHGRMAELMAAGFDAVFPDDGDPIADFGRFVSGSAAARITVDQGTAT
jgi:methylaspartate mutase sigma subunit